MIELALGTGFTETILYFLDGQDGQEVGICFRLEKERPSQINCKIDEYFD